MTLNRQAEPIPPPPPPPFLRFFWPVSRRHLRRSRPADGKVFRRQHLALKSLHAAFFLRATPPLEAPPPIPP